MLILEHITHVKYFKKKKRLKIVLEKCIFKSVLQRNIHVSNNDCKLTNEL